VVRMDKPVKLEMMGLHGFVGENFAAAGDEGENTPVGRVSYPPGRYGNLPYPTNLRRAEMIGSAMDTPEHSEVAVDPQRQEQAREYARIRHRLLLVDLLISFALVIGFLATGASRAYREFIVNLGIVSPWVQVAVYVGTLGLAYTLLFLPLSWYRSYVLPHRYGLSTQTLRGWWMDWFKMLGLEVLLGFPIVELIFWLLRTHSQSWWIWASILMVALSVVLGYIFPVLILPIFYKLTPLEDKELRRRIEMLAGRTGVEVAGVYTINLSSRTRAANAVVMGMGRTKRIALGDTLYEEFTPAEIETILAHELAHQVHHDVEIGMVVQALVTVASLYLAHIFLRWGVRAFDLQGPGDVAALPLLALAMGLFSLLLMPLTNGYSRWRERLADRFALWVTGRPEAFADAMTRLANQNLSELEPPPWVVWLLYDHPPLHQRVQMARTWSGDRGSPG